MKILSLLYGAYFFASSAIMVSIAAIVCLITAPFDPHRKLVHKVACAWGYHYLLVNPWWRCTFEGVEQINPSETYVMVANHQSYWDIMLLYGIFRHFKWVSKSSVLKIPFIGLNMLINQYVTVKRDDLKSIKQMMRDCRDWLSRGSSIMIFPEGTRSETGEIAAFHDGAFKLAAELGLKVIPIVVDGTHEIMPKNAKALNFKSDIHVRVLEPIDASEYAGRARVMRDEVRDRMIRELESIKSKA